MPRCWRTLFLLAADSFGLFKVFSFLKRKFVSDSTPPGSASSVVWQSMNTAESASCNLLFITYETRSHLGPSDSGSFVFHPTALSLLFSHLCWNRLVTLRVQKCVHIPDRYACNVTPYESQATRLLCGVRKRYLTMSC